MDGMLITLRCFRQKAGNTSNENNSKGKLVQAIDHRKNRKNFNKEKNAKINSNNVK